MFSPLVLETYDEMLPIYTQIRQDAIAASGKIGTLAISLAALLAAIAFLKIAYDMMHGKEVTLWQILKPFILISCITILPSILGFTDEVLNRVTTSILTSTTAQQMEVKQKLELSLAAEREADLLSASGAVDTYKENKKKIDKEYESDSNAKAYRRVGGKIIEVSTEASRERQENAKAKAEAATQKNIEELQQAIGKAETTANGDNSGWKTFWNLLKEGEFPTGIFSSWLMYLIQTLSDHLFKYIDAWAELTLIVMAFLAPFIFAFSILPFYSGGIQSFFARYIQISFWKVCAAAITWAQTQAKASIVAGKVNWITQIKAGNITDATFQSSAVNSAATIISIAAILCMFSIPSIASYVIESTGTGGAHASAGAGAKNLMMKAIPGLRKL